MMKLSGMVSGLMVLALVAAVNADSSKINVGGIEGSGGSVKGIVKFNGKQVARKPIRMAADPFCDKAHGKDNPGLAEMFVFGDNDTLQNVFVYVSKGLEGKTFEAPKEVAHLDQVGCMYVPHVGGIMVGQDLTILNSDSTLHNVKAESKNNGSFNEGMPVKGMKLNKQFSKTEMGMTFKCDVHPWMGAFVHVMSHPFYAVTQQDGTFELRGLPAGKYEISVWHEFNRFGPDKETYEVEVADGKASELTITYAPKASN